MTFLSVESRRSGQRKSALTTNNKGDKGPKIVEAKMIFLSATVRNSEGGGVACSVQGKWITVSQKKMDMLSGPPDTRNPARGEQGEEIAQVRFVSGMKSS